jgi:hypothetical protein
MLERPLLVSGYYLDTTKAVSPDFNSSTAAIYTSVLANKVALYLPEYVTPAALGAGLPESSLEDLFAGLAIGNFSAVPSITPAVEVAVGTAVKVAYSAAFKVLFLISITFGVCFIIAALISPNVERYLTGDVARKLVKGPVVAEKDEESQKPEISVVHIVEKS